MPPGRVTWSRFRFSTMDPVCRRSSCPGCSASSPEPTLRAREARGAPASVCRSCVDWPRPTAVRRAMSPTFPTARVSLWNETRAVGNVGLIARLTAVGLGQSTHDRQTEAGAPLASRARSVGSGELAEQPGHELRRHTGSMVENLNLDHVTLPGGIDAHGRFSVLECVLHVVVQNACQVVWIDPNDQIR